MSKQSSVVDSDVKQGLSVRMLEEEAKFRTLVLAKAKGRVRLILQASVLRAQARADGFIGAAKMGKYIKGFHKRFPMVRRGFLEAIPFWVEQFNVDGRRRGRPTGADFFQYVDLDAFCCVGLEGPGRREVGDQELARKIRNRVKSVKQGKGGRVTRVWLWRLMYPTADKMRQELEGFVVLLKLDDGLVARAYGKVVGTDRLEQVLACPKRRIRVEIPQGRK